MYVCWVFVRVLSREVVFWIQNWNIDVEYVLLVKHASFYYAGVSQYTVGIALWN